MRVKLDLKDAAGNVVETIRGDFDDGDFALLRRFISALTRVRETALLQRGLPAITNMAFNENGLTFTCMPYEDRELHELLHVLRPLILEREAASFKKIAALLQRRFGSRAFSGVVKGFRRMFEHGELAGYMQMSIASRPVFHESLLNDWLNGTQYHTDDERAAAWAVVENTLKAENVRALLITQLHGRVKALFLLGSVVDLILRRADAQANVAIAPAITPE